MKTDFDDVYDPLASIQCAKCFDCLNEKPIYNYILLDNNELMPLCYGCWLIREQKRLARIGENEKPPN